MRSLRWKMLAFALGVSASVVGGVWAIQRAIVAPEFAEIERREADANLARVAEAIAQEADQLAEHAQDYAAWDEALAFSRGKNAGFLASNFVPETFENLRIDFGLIALENGEVAFARALHAESGELASDRELERILLEPRLRLLAHDAPSSKRAGLIASERGFVLVSTAAITDNDQAAAPAGSIVFARRVDAELIAALVKRVRSDLALSDLSASGAADANAARGAGTATWHDVASDETLLAYQALADINGAPVALLRVELPRTTSRRAAAAANLTAITGAVARCCSR